MKIDKRVEICIIGTFVILLLLSISVLYFITWLIYMVVSHWWKYLGLKFFLYSTITIIFLYLSIWIYKCIVRKQRAKMLYRYNLFRRFFLELRNEHYLRSKRHRRKRAKIIRDIRRQLDLEFKRRLQSLIEASEELNESRKACMILHLKNEKERQDTRQRAEKLKEELANFKSENLRHLLPVMEERKEKMDKKIQMRNFEFKYIEQQKQKKVLPSQKLALDIPSARFAFNSFIEAVKQMDQTCKDYRGCKMYYTLYNVDYAIVNVLFTMKEFMNTNAATSANSTKRNDRGILGLCSARRKLEKELLFNQQNEQTSATELYLIEQDIGHLVSTAYSRVLFMRDNVLRNINNFDEVTPSTSTGLADQIHQLDILRAKDCFSQDDVIEVFEELRDVILPKFREYINIKMKIENIDTINTDHWERRFTENMNKTYSRKLLNHLEVGNSAAKKVIIDNPVIENAHNAYNELNRTQSVWSNVQDKNPIRKSRWLEVLRKSNKDNSVTYLTVGGVAVAFTASYLVYRYIR